MNGKKLVVVVFVLLAFIAGGVSVALASAEPVDDLFAALSDQELDVALDVFAADAVVNDEACHQYYAGQDEISDALNLEYAAWALIYESSSETAVLTERHHAAGRTIRYVDYPMISNIQVLTLVCQPRNKLRTTNPHAICHPATPQPHQF